MVGSLKIYSGDHLNKEFIMKLIAGVFLLLASLSTVAATVKITSFKYVRNAGDSVHPLAELCGTVEGRTSAPSFVRVLVDKARNPAVYNTVADMDGSFCVAVITYRGSAEVTVFGENAGIEALAK